MASLVLVALFEVAGIASIMPFMAVVMNPEIIHTNRFLEWTFQELGFQSDQIYLIALGLLVLGLLIFGNVVKAASMWITLRFHNGLYYKLARHLLARYMSLPYTFFLNRNTAELSKNILGEVQTVIGGVLDPMTKAISSLLVCTAILTLLIVVDPSVALAIALVLGGCYVSVYKLVRRKLQSIGRQQVEANAQKFKWASESLSGIKDLKVLGREHTFLQRFSLHASRHAHNNITAGLISSLPRFVLESVAFGGILLVVIYLVAQGKGISQMVPLLTLYAFAGYRLMPSLQELFIAFAKLRFSAAGLDIVHHDLMLGSQQPGDLAQHLPPVNRAPLPFKERLELREVSFSYEGTLEPTLRHLNLRVMPNTSIGLVGPTGCGKSTTVDLILGLISPSGGEFLVDGTQITAANIRQWRQNVGYVPQTIYISDDTIARNIAFGVPDEEIDIAKVREAARLAKLAEFVENELPDHYDTAIGERGVRLSGGQRQRIGIARALYRDPSILIMDEATSALDGVTEEHIMDAVRSLSGKKTIILIAHRLTTVRDCDVIYLLEHGSIASQGTFDELMRDSSWFRVSAGG
ncbi:ABC transporter ATP-binding protein [Steroidobacter denitrificans]|nr:ABC transporter ATP-binding protein [Steroidobacter denitrificans]